MNHTAITLLVVRMAQCLHNLVISFTCYPHFGGVLLFKVNNSQSPETWMLSGNKTTKAFKVKLHLIYKSKNKDKIWTHTPLHDNNLITNKEHKPTSFVQWYLLLKYNYRHYQQKVVLTCTWIYWRKGLHCYERMVLY